MSPTALQEYAWTHFPPWQFVEQQSLASEQVLPSVVQPRLPAGTARAAHFESPPQLPVQHSPAVAQDSPTLWQAGAAHLPSTPQERLQHSVPAAQLSEAALQ